MRSARAATILLAMVLLALTSAPPAAPGAERASRGAAERPRAPASKPAKTPMIHVTDLYHPHGDPDDHWDLACVYALACAGSVDLKAVVIDYPPTSRVGDPAVAAVGQMGAITGVNVPVVVGAPRRMKAPDDAQPSARPSEHAAARAILKVLRASPSPVVITVTGCCRDVALAAGKRPDVFAAKCAAVYINAGSGTPDRTKAARREYNVGLDPAAYAAMFALPCRLYWLPCFEVAPGGGEAWRVRRYGSFYRFRQDEVLPHLSPRVQRFFLYMLTRSKDLRWLRYLDGARDEKLLAEVGRRHRNMWSTASFLHAAGRTVTRAGRIVPLGAAAEDAVFAFEPVRVTCDGEGVTTWRHERAASRRFMFHVRDTKNYAAAMTQAVRSLLSELP